LFPARKTILETRYAQSIASTPDDSRRTAGIEIGQRAAARILEIRATDGSASTVSYTPGTDPGDWQKTPPALLDPLLPQWGQVTPWVLSSSSQFRPEAPPTLDSSDYARDLNEVQQLGAVNSTTRTPEQTDIAKFWASGPGTATPPGQWNMIASIIAQEQQLSLPQSARMYAILDMSLADAAILCWNTKYHYELWRPVTAIQKADTDGNDKTTADPAWLPLLTTPPFPTYTSGHSTFSAAGATVLAGIFGTDNITFTLPSEVSGVAGRAFNSLSAAAAEAGRSRIFGGIHFEFDNVA
ncbi:MAG: vanadium-dependent haloperoxidase, partial [Planctomycetaceae bacterium]